MIISIGNPGKKENKKGFNIKTKTHGTAMLDWLYFHPKCYISECVEEKYALFVSLERKWKAKKQCSIENYSVQ